jgi:hypothetical protein
MKCMVLATTIGPTLHLATLFEFRSDGRMTITREPGGRLAPLFSLVRGDGGCAWAVRADVPDDVARELGRLADEEPLVSSLRYPPVHAERYVELLSASGQPLRTSLGPAYRFPERLSAADDLVVVENERQLERHFPGWVVGEIAAGRAPVMAIVEDGHPVSICFCARSSAVAAEAGLETAAAFRGRGFGPRVTAAWARAIAASGRVPLYSTSWTNEASLAVARKLGLVAYACHFGVSW